MRHVHRFTCIIANRGGALEDPAHASGAGLSAMYLASTLIVLCAAAIAVRQNAPMPA
jgi:hypothetical protein